MMGEDAKSYLEFLSNWRHRIAKFKHWLPVSIALQSLRVLPNLQTHEIKLEIYGISLFPFLKCS